MTRIAAAPYLNSRPLTWGLAFDPCAPAEGARRLAEGHTDVALVPLASVARAGDWVIAPGLCVASRGPVQSVLLLADCKLEDIETVVLDSSSRTSAVLVRLLLEGKTENSVRYEQLDPSRLGAAVSERQAALVIGDLALTMSAARKFTTRLDLGAAWTEMTGLPFVFAVWAGRFDTMNAEVCRTLTDAADEGDKHRDQIASEAEGMDAQAAGHYLAESIQTRLGEQELAGAKEFLRRATEAKLLPPTTLRFVDDAPEIFVIGDLLARGARGERLSVAELVCLHDQADLMALGQAAEARRLALHPKPVVTYIVDRNINYTNVCTTACRFCAFFRPPGDDEGYVLDREVLARKMTEVRDAGGIQILLQGGLHPDLPLTWYEDLFAWMKREFPTIALHALSPEEILHLTRLESLSIEEVLTRLMKAGLDSLPGGGAEILVDRVRKRIAALKCTSEGWLQVMRVAHRLGMRASSTMMYGIGESARDRVEHLVKLRDLQDETDGFTAFICWPFQPGNTKLAGDGKTATAPMYLRQVAVARLALDNIRNIQASWPTMGPAVGQVALGFGANDFGSVMFEENVVSSAGTVFSMDADAVEKHILAAGFQPARRNMRYQPVSE